MNSSIDIEGQALNGLRDYIEYSPIIANHLREGDRDPLWDGHLYLYSDGVKDNAHLIDKISVQVKGKEVEKFKLDGFKYPIEKVALRAYLSDPVVFIVCQLKTNTKEKKLFYRCLLPVTINNILKGKENQDTISVMLKPMPDKCEEFENILSTFIGDRRRQLFHSRTLTMEDVKKRGILEFELSAPIKQMNKIEMLQYISSHDSFIYAKIDSELNISVPIETGGECRMIFDARGEMSVSVGNRLFYNHVDTKIENGIIKCNTENALTFEINELSNINPRNIHVNIQADKLESRIKEYEFVLALCEEKTISIGGYVYDVEVDGFGDVEEIKRQYKFWIDVQNLLNKMHVTKSLLFSSLKQGDKYRLKILIDAILYGKKVEVPSPTTALHIMSVGNIKLLIYTFVEADQSTCQLGDFFEWNTMEIGFKKKGEIVVASPFSYLRVENLWKIIDNIPFDEQIASMQSLPAKHKDICEMANGDVLAMIACADKLSPTEERYNTLLLRAEELSKWLEKEDNDMELKVLHRVNKLQIHKRLCTLTSSEIKWLHSVLRDEKTSIQLKIGVSALLDDKKAFDMYKNNLKPKDFKYLNNQPIAKFFPK